MMPLPPLCSPRLDSVKSGGNSGDSSMEEGELMVSLDDTGSCITPPPSSPDDCVILSGPVIPQISHSTGRWFFSPESLASTKSIQWGMSVEDEATFRRIGVRTISRIHDRLGYGPVVEFGNNGKNGFRDNYTVPPARTVSAAACFFHRFYMIHPFQIFHPVEMAATCYHLASKTEERPKSLDEVIGITRHILRKSLTTGSIFDWKKDLARDINQQKETLFVNENLLLSTLNFNYIIVEHPFTYHTENCLRTFKALSPDVLNQLRRRLNFSLEASLESTLCVQWDARTIAITFVILACDKENIPLRASEKIVCQPEYYGFEDFIISRDNIRKINEVLIACISSRPNASPSLCVNILPLYGGCVTYVDDSKTAASFSPTQED